MSLDELRQEDLDADIAINVWLRDAGVGGRLHISHSM